MEREVARGGHEQWQRAWPTGQGIEEDRLEIQERGDLEWDGHMGVGINKV